ncbi:MAG: hypothetical protein IIX47_00385 [Spirochaetaceae bacterium]|nr:hypothetical protein [Spirochaetaceae bacterium]MBQ5876902.1 hypothetical protein [Treponema sp.]
MTEVEITKFRNDCEQSKLYLESSSVHKHFQHVQFGINEIELNGQQCRTEDINGNMIPVIYNFKNGYIHNEEDLPAVEYPMHWEYWKDGLIVKVVDMGGDTEEYWENGVPVRIEKNLAERRNNGENI